MFGFKSLKKPYKDNKLHIKVFLIFIVIFMIFTVFCFQYYKKLHATIREESKGYLHEVSRRIGDNVDRIINDNFAVLNTMASVVEGMENTTRDEIYNILKKQYAFWNYQNIMFVDETGKAYDLNDDEIFITLNQEIRKDLLQKKQSMSISQIINNNEYIIFCVPMENVSIDDKKIIAFAASYAPSSFVQVLSMTSFNEQAYSQIVTKNGIAVTKPSSDYAIQTGFNVFSTLKKAQFDDGDSIDKMLTDVNAGGIGQIGFTMDNVHRYLVCTPIASQGWHLLTFVPVKVVNEKSDTLLKTTLLLCCFITVIFAILSAMLVYIFNRNKTQLENIAYVDSVTGGNTLQYFYLLAENILENAHDGKYAIIYTNIEKFKVLNEQLGRANGDDVLKFFNDFMQSVLHENECIGRLSADNFCVLVNFEDEQELVERFKKWREVVDEKPHLQEVPWGLPNIEFGIYIITDFTLPFPQMIDRAKLALRETLWAIDSKLHYAFYDDEARRKLFREKHLEDKMEYALEHKEFQMYLQPKYSLPSETIGGAEALVRWISTDEGMIYPDEFIPLFEKNGFVIKLDLFVFEKACETIQSWLDRGIKPVKISVNCSRVHFKDLNFLDAYIHVIEQYKIPRHYIEIEITESVVFENSEYLIQIIQKIREAGFGCSMDDFGSGYSALNMLRTIPVDTLKLDRIFFKTIGADDGRTEAVVTNIVSLAKALSMQTVAEGVEYREQVEMLKSAGCDYIQGYVYAKPMPVAEFEALDFKEIEKGN